ncbi:6-phosphogluconolactonase (cycloisomerase 2 family) [Silvibacterium bohemicum]|uniref:6-phosphogluconolactonase (Cycloisomerase 2 family) n=1 Tax=Silvibacterium bohemicum TaxID=1577686 RepID=A0A841JZ56_9BACT|nr:beta-propeller fold lactonase family protein [Silvibacterium bohemicum]MBB6143264.1 6-phosphogluconolactonase (cycloisomerase 2 family) [Silvibacterium bohemicum]
MRFWKVLPLGVISLLLGGCGQFFPKESSNPTPPGGSGNYVYVANGETGTIAGFSVGTSSIAAVSGSPNSLGVAPSAMAATPSGSFLYVSSIAGVIFGYSIGSNGALTLLNGGSPLISSITPTAMAVDQSGNWLIAVDPTPIAYIFPINTSTGLLGQQAQLTLDPGVQNTTELQNTIVFSPNNNFVYISLGAGGVDTFTFNATTGALTGPTGNLKPKQSTNGAQGLAVDPGNKYLFVAESGTDIVRVLSIGTTGGVTEVTGSPYAVGVGPTAVLVDSTGSYVYVANKTSNTISAFLLSATGGLTAIAGSPFTTGTTPVGLAEDITDKYLEVANTGGSPDLQLFSILTTTPGALQSFATATTGTDPTGALAVVSAK